MGPLAQVGLALATSVGAWINLTLLAIFARRQGFAVSGAAIGKPVAILIAAGVVLTASLLAGAYGLDRVLADLTVFREETMLALLVLLGALVYGLAVFLLLGRPWLKGLLREVSVAADTKAPPELDQTDPTDDSAALPDNEPPPKA
jgi:putative peptidoglycan lipid II flippase